MIKPMALDIIITQMVLFTKENGVMISRKAWARRHG